MQKSIAGSQPNGSVFCNEDKIGLFGGERINWKIMHKKCTFVNNKTGTTHNKIISIRKLDDLFYKINFKSFFCFCSFRVRRIGWSAKYF